MIRTKKGIAYIRVSTKNQGDNGNGLDLQLIRIRAYANQAGIEIIKVYQDVHSGVGEDSLGKRAGAQAAIEHAKKSRIPIIVDGLDRFSRATSTLEELVSNDKLKVISCKSGEGAALAVTIAEIARAQAQAEIISKTTKVGLERARQAGKRLGNPTNLDEAQRNGAAKNRRKAEHQAKELAPTVKQIRNSGAITREAIAAELNRMGSRTLRENTWNKDTLRRVLDRIDEIEKQNKRNCANPAWGGF